MAIAIRGSTYKTKMFEQAYNGLRGLSMYDLSDELENKLASYGFVFKLVGKNFKVRNR